MSIFFQKHLDLKEKTENENEKLNYIKYITVIKKL